MLNQSRNVRIYAEVDVVKQTIDKASAANLLDILHNYDVHIDPYNRRTCCPFSFHKGGQERSGSFYYYPDTNSFYCFGCKSGGTAVDFVSLYEDVNRYNAALIIVSNFETNASNITERNTNHHKVYLEFSHLVRNFMLNHKHDEKALNYAEYVCSAFDNIRNKYNLDPDGLNIIFTKLKRKLEEFK
jgi:DNA primase